MVLAMSVGAVAQAQESTESTPAESASVFGTSPGVGGLVAPVTRVTGIEGQAGLTVGARAGLVVHHALSVEFEVHGLASPTIGHPDNQQVLSMTYQGLFVDYTFLSSQPIQGGLHLFAGFGEAHYRASDDRTNISEVTALSVVEVGATVNYAPFPWLRVQGGPGFRMTPSGSAGSDGPQLGSLSGSDFWAPYGELSVALGWL